MRMQIFSGTIVSLCKRLISSKREGGYFRQNHAHTVSKVAKVSNPLAQEESKPENEVRNCVFFVGRRPSSLWKKCLNS